MLQLIQFVASRLTGHDGINTLCCVAVSCCILQHCGWLQCSSLCVSRWRKTLSSTSLWLPQPQLLPLQSDAYFISNTKFYFLEGLGLFLHRTDPITVSKVDNFELYGDGQWVPGPEMTVMESTAIIYYVKGSGGFFLPFFSLPKSHCMQHFSSLIMKLTLINASIQNSTGRAIVSYNCQLTSIQSCSIAYSNIDRTSEYVQCNKNIDGSNCLFMMIITNNF